MPICKLVVILKAKLQQWFLQMKSAWVRFHEAGNSCWFSSLGPPNPAGIWPSPEGFCHEKNGQPNPMQPRLRMPLSCAWYSQHLRLIPATRSVSCLIVKRDQLLICFLMNQTDFTLISLIIIHHLYSFVISHSWSHHISSLNDRNSLIMVS